MIDSYVDIDKLDYKLRDELDRYLLNLVNSGGSDLHIKAGGLMRRRIRGEILPVATNRVMSPDEALTLSKELLRTRFEELVTKKSVDFAYRLNENYNFRVNIFFQMEGVSFAFRAIPNKLPTFEELKLPPVIERICKENYRGLILVTGPTGSGKTTTLASMINYINQHRKSHIITIEDPIEFAYKDDKCIINQRSIGQDALSFADALRGALREDPDIILVGELRDLETMSIAMHAAETGHLVLSTLHTVDAKDTISRIISMFQGDERERTKLSVSSVLKAVISQRLCKTADGRGRVAAMEIMLSTPRIKKLILESKASDMIYDAISESSLNSGMQTFDAHLLKLFETGVITEEEALETSSRRNDLEIRIKSAKMQMKEDKMLENTSSVEVNNFQTTAEEASSLKLKTI